MSRPRKPTELKRLEGNRGHRSLGRQEPDPDYLDDARCTTAPPTLSKAAQLVWVEFAPKMRKAKVLTVIDVEPFGRWCELVVRYRTVKADIERQGVMLKREGEKGGHVVNQLVFVESMLLKQLLAVEREFGMTPAARTRVQVDPQLTLFGQDDGAGADSGEKPKAETGSRFFTGTAERAH